MDLHLHILIPKNLQRAGWKPVAILPLTGLQKAVESAYHMETPQAVFWLT